MKRQIAMRTALCAALLAAPWMPGARAADGGLVKIDGSSTVFPITEAVAEEFQQKNAGMKATVGISGTGGGFKAFCRGEIDVADASRPIKTGAGSETELCRSGGIEPFEVQVAIDGLAVVVHKDNDFVTDLKVSELRSEERRVGKGDWSSDVCSSDLAAPAAASRRSAVARSTSPTPAARSRPARAPRRNCAGAAASSPSRSRSPSTALPSWSTRTTTS